MDAVVSSESRVLQTYHRAMSDLLIPRKRYALSHGLPGSPDDSVDYSHLENARDTTPLRFGDPVYAGYYVHPNVNRQDVYVGYLLPEDLSLMGAQATPTTLHTVGLVDQWKGQLVTPPYRLYNR